MRTPRPAIRRSPVRTWARVLAALVLAVAAVGLVVGCGGGSDASSARTDGGGAAAGAPSSQGSSDSAQGQAQFARCMRDRGVDIPDPAEGGARPQGRPPAGGIDSDAARQAMQACRQYLQGAGGRPTAPDAPGFQGAGSEFAQCMRDEGVDLPEPTAGQTPAPGSGGLDSADPSVQAALRRCGSLIQGGVPGQDNSR